MPVAMPEKKGLCVSGTMMPQAAARGSVRLTMPRSAPGAAGRGKLQDDGAPDAGAPSGDEYELAGQVAAHGFLRSMAGGLVSGAGPTAGPTGISGRRARCRRRRA